MSDLVKREEQGLVIAGLENMDAEDMVLPTLYPDGKMGCFRDSLDEKSKKSEMTGILLTYNKGYKLREGDPPKTTCRSFFGDVGTFGTSCEGCPKRVKHEGQRDFCKRVYDFLFIPDGQDMPAIVSITAVTSLSNVKKYLTLFGKKLKRPLFSAKTKLALVEEKNAKGQTYFVITFEKMDDVSVKDQERYLELIQLYRQRKSNDDVEKDDDAVDINKFDPNAKEEPENWD